MSTRSGKRIHRSFDEGALKAEEELVPNSERKTRSKRLKENDGQLHIPKTRKLNNYVRYPTDDDSNTQAKVTETAKVQNPRKLRRNTLKDHNFRAPVAETLDTDDDVKEAGRQTRKTKKFIERCDEVPAILEMVEIVPEKKLKSKKMKKKSKNATETGTEMENGVIRLVKKSKRKKKGKKSNSITKEVESKSLNKSTSVDSFYSAAGSPMQESSVRDSLNIDPEVQHSTECIKPDTTYEKNETIDITTDAKRKSDMKSKRKSSIKNSTFDKIQSPSLTIGLHWVFDKNESAGPTENINTTYEKEPTVQESKSQRESEAVSHNSTYDKKKESTENINTTFEIEPTSRKSSRGNPDKEIVNNTFEKTSKQSKTASLNSTYDKETEIKLNTTFDKTNSKSNSAKSSLMSSDATINITFDKSNENSRISITSDDSKTENIINITPLLIESSIDESQMSNTTHRTSEICNVRAKESADDSKAADLKPPTNMVREGTFTKDSPDVLISSPKTKISVEKTSTRRMTLPSPGFTPFHTSRSSQMEKTVLNVTRSIEKSLRRSSLTELVPKQTKVMFCSPVNNTAVVMQQTRKVIKSSMKGSNKSFVFDESDAASVGDGGGARGAAGRKRARTHDAGERALAKRTRLAPDAQQRAADARARPRTSSAAAKLYEATPAPRPLTPRAGESAGRGPAAAAAARARTKLPDFAALHQRRFDKMESLGECQERKRKRARLLLTPTGAVALAHRSSPTGIEPLKDLKKTPKTDIATPKPAVQKAVTASKTHTLESLRPGYTRFGFKMNVNPFSVPNKRETKTKETKPNGIANGFSLPNKKEPKAKEIKSNGVSKNAIKPSSTGSTSSRKDVAKQTVMREKSFTSLSGKRDVTRRENRTIIKGVRTNRRFDLQMMMRDIN